MTMAFNHPTCFLMATSASTPQAHQQPHQPNQPNRNHHVATRSGIAIYDAAARHEGLRHVFGLLDHVPADGGDAGGDGHARQHALGSPEEPICGVHRDLVGELLGVEQRGHPLVPRRFRRRHVLLGLFPKLGQVFQQRRHHAPPTLDEFERAQAGFDRHALPRVGSRVGQHQGGVAQVVGPDDGRVHCIQFKAREGSRCVVRTCRTREAVTRPTGEASNTR